MKICAYSRGERRREGACRSSRWGVCEGTWSGAEVGTASWCRTCHSAAQGRGTRVSKAPVPTVPGSDCQGTDTRSKRGLPSLSSYARETVCSSAGSWQLGRLPSHWILFCVSERGAVAEIIKLSSFWMKEGIL